MAEHVIALAPAAGSAPEVWACHFVKKCGWQGLQSELAWVPMKGVKLLNATKAACPKCGQSSRGFSKVKPNNQLSHAPKDASQGHE